MRWLKERLISSTTWDADSVYVAYQVVFMFNHKTPLSTSVQFSFWFLLKNRGTTKGNPGVFRNAKGGRSVEISAWIFLDRLEDIAEAANLLSGYTIREVQSCGLRTPSIEPWRRNCKCDYQVEL